MKYQEFSHTISISKDELPKFGIDKLFRKAEEIGNAMGKHMTEKMLDTLDKASAEADTGVSVGNKPLTAEAVLEGFEKINMDFGIDGKQPPNIALFMSPAMAKQAEAVQKEIDANPALQTRFDQMIIRKRHDFYARESHRRLVD